MLPSFISFDPKDIEDHAQLLLPLFNQHLDQLVEKEVIIQNLNQQLNQSVAQIQLLQTEKESLLNGVQHLQAQVETMKLKQLENGLDGSQKQVSEKVGRQDLQQAIFSVEKGKYSANLKTQQTQTSEDRFDNSSAPPSSNRGLVREREEGEKDDVREPPPKKQFTDNLDNYSLSHPIIIMQGIIAVQKGGELQRSLLDMTQEKFVKVLTDDVGIPEEFFLQPPQLDCNNSQHINDDAGALTIDNNTYQLVYSWAVLDQHCSPDFLSSMKHKLKNYVQGKSDYLQFLSDWNLMCSGVKEKQLPSQENCLFVYEATPEDVLKFMPESCQQYLIRKQVGSGLSCSDDARVRKQMEDDEYLSLLDDDCKHHTASLVSTENLAEQQCNLNKERIQYEPINVDNQEYTIPFEFDETNSLIQMIQSTREELRKYAQEKLQLISKWEEDNSTMEMKFSSKFQEMKKLLEERAGHTDDDNQVFHGVEKPIAIETEKGTTDDAQQTIKAMSGVQQQEIQQTGNADQMFQDLNKRLKIMGCQFTCQQILKMPLKCVVCDQEILPFLVEPECKQLPENSIQDQQWAEHLTCHKCKVQKPSIGAHCLEGAYNIQENELNQQSVGQKQQVDVDEINRRLKLMGIQSTIQDILEMPLQCCICQEDLVPWEKEPTWSNIPELRFNKEARNIQRKNWVSNVQNRFFVRNSCQNGCAGFCLKCSEQTWQSQNKKARRRGVKVTTCFFCETNLRSKPCPFVLKLRQI